MCKVLVIEDDPSVRESIKDALELRDHGIITAENGLEALEICKTELPDLIISDIMMPYMNGYEVLNALQKNPKTSSIPFIFLSAKASTSDIRVAMNGGADDYLTKPFKVKELLEAVDTRLKKKERFDKTVNHITNGISQFVPHELRTPLVGILGYTELLINEYDKINSGEVLDMLRVIQESGSRLHRTIEKFLLYAELSILEASLHHSKESREYSTLSPGEVNICIRRIVNTYNRINDIKLDIEEAVTVIPEKYLKKMFEETVENALKFSENGSTIEIKGRAVNNEYILEIIDYGIGITKEQLELLSPFVQIDREKIGQNGNGLGLAIVKKIIEIYKGRFEIESEKNNYTHITLALPMN